MTSILFLALLAQGWNNAEVDTTGKITLWIQNRHYLDTTTTYIMTVALFHPGFIRREGGLRVEYRDLRDNVLVLRQQSDLQLFRVPVQSARDGLNGSLIVLQIPPIKARKVILDIMLTQHRFLDPTCLWRAQIQPLMIWDASVQRSLSLRKELRVGSSILLLVNQPMDTAFRYSLRVMDPDTQNFIDRIVTPATDPVRLMHFATDRRGVYTITLSVERGSGRVQLISFWNYMVSDTTIR